MRLTSKSAPGHYKVYVYCRQINYLSFNCYKRARSVDYLSRKRSKDSGLNYDAVFEDGGQINFCIYTIGRSSSNVLLRKSKPTKSIIP